MIPVKIVYLVSLNIFYQIINVSKLLISFRIVKYIVMKNNALNVKIITFKVQILKSVQKLIKIKIVLFFLNLNVYNANQVIFKIILYSKKVFINQIQVNHN